MGQSQGLGDQQARRAFTLGWLAGIVDGEGCFIAHVRRRSRNAQRQVREYPVPQLSIDNSDRNIIEGVAAALDELGVGRWVSPAYSGDMRRVLVHGYKRLNKLLPLLIPHLRSWKREQAIALHEFVKSRLSRTRPGKSRANGIPVTEDEWDLIRTVKALKKVRSLRGHTSANPSPEK